MANDQQQDITLGQVKSLLGELAINDHSLVQINARLKELHLVTENFETEDEARKFLQDEYTRLSRDKVVGKEFTATKQTSSPGETARLTKIHIDKLGEKIGTDKEGVYDKWREQINKKWINALSVQEIKEIAKSSKPEEIEQKLEKVVVEKTQASQEEVHQAIKSVVENDPQDLRKIQRDARVIQEEEQKWIQYRIDHDTKKEITNTDILTTTTQLLVEENPNLIEDTDKLWQRAVPLSKAAQAWNERPIEPVNSRVSNETLDTLITGIEQQTGVTYTKGQTVESKLVLIQEIAREDLRRFITEGENPLIAAIATSLEIKGGSTQDQRRGLESLIRIPTDVIGSVSSSPRPGEETEMPMATFSFLAKLYYRNGTTPFFLQQFAQKMGIDVPNQSEWGQFLVFLNLDPKKSYSQTEMDTILQMGFLKNKAIFNKKTGLLLDPEEFKEETQSVLTQMYISYLYLVNPEAAAQFKLPSLNGEVGSSLGGIAKLGGAATQAAMILGSGGLSSLLSFTSLFNFGKNMILGRRNRTGGQKQKNDWGWVWWVIIIIFGSIFALMLFTSDSVNTQLASSLGEGENGKGTGLVCTADSTDPECKVYQCDTATQDCRWPVNCGFYLQGPYDNSFSHAGLNAIDFGMSACTDKTVKSTVDGVIESTDNYPYGLNESIYCAPDGDTYNAANGYCNNKNGRSGYGNYVIIKENGTGHEFLYGHLDPAFKVSEGQPVTKGEKIGVADNNGYSAGTHLHFELLGGTANPRVDSFLPKTYEKGYQIPPP